MNTYRATVIRAGNSYALRVPIAYVGDAGLEVGEKVELPAPHVRRTQDKKAVKRAIRELRDVGAYREIEDPIGWQREVRRERPLPKR